MARLPRVVVPDLPHHVTQRGNRRQTTFFVPEDFSAYKRLLAWQCGRHAVDIVAYCLLPNHVHLIVVPPRAVALRAAVAETHRRYTTAVNQREGWRGCLWQGRFASFPLAPGHLYRCMRYVELNPVRAGLVARPEDWPHSSAASHLWPHLEDDLLAPCWRRKATEMVGDWRPYLYAGLAERKLGRALRIHTGTGRPLGDPAFLEELEARLGRRLQRLRPGPRPTGSR